MFTNTSYLGTSNQTGTFLAAMFMSLFVIYGFDTASTLAEETKNPRRLTPRVLELALRSGAPTGSRAERSWDYPRMVRKQSEQ